MVPGTGSLKKVVIIIGTINFEIFESRTVWPTEVEKSSRFLYLTIVAWTSNLFCYFCNALDVSSSKNEVGYIQGKHFNKSENTERSNHLADQDEKAAAFWFYPIRRDVKLYLQSFRQIESEN